MTDLPPGPGRDRHHSVDQAESTERNGPVDRGGAHHPGDVIEPDTAVGRDDGGRAGSSGPDERDRSTKRIADGSSVLLLAAADAAAERAYTRLEPGSVPARTRVLAVTYSRTPDEWATDWRTHVGALPTDLQVIAVGETTRSTVATAPTGTGNGPHSGTRMLRSVGDPADLTGVGMGISECLADWEADSGSGTSRPVVSLGSLAVLLDHVPLDRAFQFLHVLSGRVARTGAVGYYYLDPAEQDSRTIATLTTLFDAVVDHTDGDWTIETR